MNVSKSVVHGKIDNCFHSTLRLLRTGGPNSYSNMLYTAQIVVPYEYKNQTQHRKALDELESKIFPSTFHFSFLFFSLLFLIITSHRRPPG